jgi:hypothetical protein
MLEFHAGNTGRTKNAGILTYWSQVLLMSMGVRICILTGRAIAQKVSRRTLTAEDRIRSCVSPFGICGARSGVGTDFSQSSLAFRFQCHSTVTLHTHMSGGWTIGPLVAAVQRQSHPIDMNMPLQCAHRWVYYSTPTRYEYGEPRRNDTDKGKPKNSEENLSQCHSVHHKSHMDWQRRDSGPPRWEADE